MIYSQKLICQLHLNWQSYEHKIYDFWKVLQQNLFYIVAFAIYSDCFKKNFQL